MRASASHEAVVGATVVGAVVVGAAVVGAAVVGAWVGLRVGAKDGSGEGGDVGSWTRLRQL